MSKKTFASNVTARKSDCQSDQVGICGGTGGVDIESGRSLNLHRRIKITRNIEGSGEGE
ncbi:MAG: hypothetical protein VKL39_14715 [Leptolyngbyaceae bacterium]|nr:hypothetical protein [Leptolyngbyaceae bacterium]